jgi:hypothetical protein
MTELRQRLIAGGWKQGVILDTSSLEKAGVTGLEDSIGYLVLTQTCDCINPDFVKEPHLELLPLMLRNTKKGRPDPNYENGKNPREIHFWITFHGEQKCVVSRIKDIQLVNREAIEDFRFSENILISPGCIDDIIEWRAARYSRTAFPEAFETAFRAISERFGEIIERHESTIDSLMISISPPGEIVEGDGYEIHLHLMITPAVMGQPEATEALKKSAKELEELFTTCSAFAFAECKVSNLDDLTLWKARTLLDFSRYDYLSFGKEDDAPED